MISDKFVWHTEVRGYELDNQNIVNHANYLHYFDNTRIKHLLAKGIDWDDYARRGFNLVVAEVTINFKAPLRAHDEFYVTSQFTRKGRIMIGSEQSIIRKLDQKLMTTAENKVVCVNTQTGRPCMPEEIIQTLFLESSN